jgi:hypothetical protein
MPEIELPVINPRKPGKRLFGPDNPPPGKGRPRGSVNKANKDLKNGLLTAAINLGRDGYGEGGLVGYCEFLGLYHPKAFAGLLGKLLPLQVNADVNNAVVGEVRVISVPAGCYLSAEQIAKMNPAAPLIDQAPQLEPERFEKLAEVDPEYETAPEPKPESGVVVVKSANLRARQGR